MPKPFSAPYSKRLLALMLLHVIVGGAYVSYRSTEHFHTFQPVSWFVFHSCLVLTNLGALLWHRNFPRHVVLHLTLNVLTAINGAFTGLFVLGVALILFRMAAEQYLDLPTQWHEYLFYLPLVGNMALVWVFVQPVKHQDR